MGLYRNVNGVLEPVAGTPTNIINQIQQENADVINVVASKNILPITRARKDHTNPQTINGITFTINDDGSITVNGTATAQINYIISDLFYDEFPKENLILSSQNANLSGFYVYLSKVNSSGTFLGDLARTAGGGPATFTIVGQTFYKTINGIFIKNGQVIDNVTVYPMVRLASIEDDTYAPYAMTNQEITKKLTDSGQVTATDVIWTTGYNNIVAKSGNSVNLCCGGIAATTSIVPQSTVLAKLPEGYRPKINVPISMIWSATSSNPTLMSSFALVKADGTIVSMHGSAATNMQYWMLSGSFGV